MQEGNPEREIEKLAREMCDADAAYDDGVVYPPGCHPPWIESDKERRNYWLGRAERSLASRTAATGTN